MRNADFMTSCKIVDGNTMVTKWHPKDVVKDTKGGFKTYKAVNSRKILRNLIRCAYGNKAIKKEQEKYRFMNDTQRQLYVRTLRNVLIFRREGVK